MKTFFVSFSLIIIILKGFEIQYVLACFILVQPHEQFFFGKISIVSLYGKSFFFGKISIVSLYEKSFFFWFYDVQFPADLGNQIDIGW